jgi:uridine kinase
MNNMITIYFSDNTSKEYPKGITCLDIIKDKNMPNDIIACKINNTLVSLNEKITKLSKIEFLDLNCLEANNVYSRGLQYIYVLAVKEVLGRNTNVNLEHSIDKGIYTKIEEHIINELILNKIKEKMLEIINRDIPFKKVIVSRKDAIDYYNNIKANDKIKSLKYVVQHNIDLYQLDYLYDYFYGEMPISTGVVKRFELSFIAPNGIVLRGPINASYDIPEYVHHQKLFDVFQEHADWGNIIKINNAADLNDQVSNGKAGELIRMSESVQNDKLYKIANQIFDNKKNIKIILIAGPTSSGKTTTAHKLALYLKSMGLNPNSISLDDYYLNKEEMIKDEQGNIDFETIDALDIRLFNEHMNKLLNKEEVSMPTFNFLTGKKEYKNKILKLKDNDIIIIEGLHALNEKMTSSIKKEYKFKIYISPLTSLNIDSHNRIPTTFVRKLRRMIRDYKYRGASAEETLGFWDSIRRGEEKYIFPFQDDADVIFNTSLIYEIGVLRVYAEPLLFSISDDSIYSDQATKIINFLKNFLPIPADEIPIDSLLREFVGGSCFKD